MIPVQGVQNQTIAVLGLGRSGRATAAALAAGGARVVAWDDSANLLYLTESSSTSARVWVVTPVNADDANTWTIAPLVNNAGTLGFADGSAATARLRESGLDDNAIGNLLAYLSEQKEATGTLPTDRTIEVLDGLQPGDRVILSDMSQHDSTDRVRLN